MISAASHEPDSCHAVKEFKSGIVSMSILQGVIDQRSEGWCLD